MLRFCIGNLGFIIILLRFAANWELAIRVVYIGKMQKGAHTKYLISFSRNRPMPYFLIIM